MWNYSKEVMDHFMNPRNVGEIENPDGVGEVNQKAIDHYNKVIDKLIACGQEPFVDLYHWDMPQSLQERGGFACPAFPEWFEAYA